MGELVLTVFLHALPFIFITSYPHTLLHFNFQSESMFSSRVHHLLSVDLFGYTGFSFSLILFIMVVHILVHGGRMSRYMAPLYNTDSRGRVGDMVALHVINDLHVRPRRTCYETKCDYIAVNNKKS